MTTATLTYEAAARRETAARNPETLRFARNVALFLLAPFIGLAYALAFPVVGLAALAWFALRAARERNNG
jgi:hypothetical protein